MNRVLSVVFAVALLLAVLASSAAAAPLPPEARELMLGAEARFMVKFPGARIGFAGHLPSLITGFSAELAGDDRAGAAHMFIQDWSDLFGYDRVLTSLAFQKTMDLEKTSVYRFGQVHQGLQVLDADIVVTTDREGRAVMVSSSLKRLQEIPVDFSISRSDAIFAAVRDLNPTLWPGKAARAGKAIANIGGRHEAVWVVDLFAERPFGLWRVFVARDALKALGFQNLMRTAKGYAYPDCPELGNYTEVELKDLTSSTRLTGTYVDVFSNCNPGYGCSSSNKQASADGQGNFLITPKEGNTTDPFAEVNAYYHVNHMHDYFVGNGFNYLSYQMDVAVNYTRSYDMACNAAFAGNGIIVGLCNQVSPGINFAYDADVVMHEYTHGAVDSVTSLGMYSVDEWGLVGMPYGLNEGSADFFPGDATNDAVTGRHIDKTMPGAVMRDMGNQAYCPGSLVGEGHEDGKIWASANWTARKKASGDPNIGKAALLSVPSWSNQITFQDAANIVLSSASAYGQAVQDAFQSAYEEHGMLGCGREVEIQDGALVTGWLLNPQMLYIQSSTTPFIIQAKLNVPAGSSRLELTTTANDLATWNDVTSKVRVYVNQGSHVQYSSYGSTSADWSSNGQTLLTISNPQAGWYYILPVGTSYGSSQGYQFQVSVKYYGVDPPDAGYDAGVKDAGYDAGSKDTGVKPDSGVKPDAGGDAGVKTDAGTDAGGKDVGVKPDTGVVTDTGVTPDVGPKPDVGSADDDTGIPPKTDGGGGGGGNGGGEECVCDQTYDCDPDCECDPECAAGAGTDAAAAGCGCTTVEL